MCLQSPSRARLRRRSFSLSDEINDQTICLSQKIPKPCLPKSSAWGTVAWLVNDLWSNGHRFCLPFASLRVAVFLWEADSLGFGQVSCMLNLCANDCVHESGGIHGTDPLCAPQPGDRWDAGVPSGLGRALMKGAG